MLQLDLDPISDHLPAAQSVQPSDFVVAAVFVDFVFARHSLAVQLVLIPPIDKFPTVQFLHLLVIDNAAERVEYLPAGHSWS